MGLRTNEEIIAHWSREPAPLLPILHAFHDRDGYLSEEVLRDVSRVPQDSPRRPLRNGDLLPPFLPRAGGAGRSQGLHGTGMRPQGIAGSPGGVGGERRACHALCRTMR